MANAQATSPASPEPRIITDDVERFYALYHAHGGEPSAAALQGYIDAGSAGLGVFAKRRRITGERIARKIAEAPEVYRNARKCVAALPAAKARLGDALAELRDLYPQANYPAVTVVIGAGKPIGIGYRDTGVQIGLEALCAVDYFNPDIENRLVGVIAHEYVHVQQTAELTELNETDLSDWMFNGSLAEPGDLGYWVGYRIAKAYYRQADDKSTAVRDMLETTDAQAFLERSGWYPGIDKVRRDLGRAEILRS